MSEFLVEAYISRVTAETNPPRLEIASQAAEQLTREGTPVSFLYSIFLPEDETCLFLYRASSVEAVVEAVTRAGLPFERVVEAVSESIAATG